jgi:hypothetical protein
MKLGMQYEGSEKCAVAKGLKDLSFELSGEVDFPGQPVTESDPDDVI